MIDETQLARLAGMAHALRPDWPTKSLLTYLHAHHAGRPFRDLAVALAWVAADPATQTPKRLEADGPWWRAVAVETPPSTPNTDRLEGPCPEPGCGLWRVRGEGHVCARRADSDHARAMRDAAKAAVRNAARPKETT